MLNTILRSKTYTPRFLLSHTTITLLIATLLSLTSVTFADSNQLLFRQEDFKDPGSLAVKLQDTRAAIPQSIAAQLSDETQQLLREYDGISSPPRELQKALLDDLNRTAPSLLALRCPKSWQHQTEQTDPRTPCAKPPKRRSIGSSKPIRFGRCLSL